MRRNRLECHLNTEEIIYQIFSERCRIFPSFSRIFPEEKIRRIRGENPVLSPVTTARVKKRLLMLWSSVVHSASLVPAFKLDVTHGGIDEIVGCGQRICPQFPQPGCQEGDQLVSKGSHRIDWILCSWAHPRSNPYVDQNFRMVRVCMPMEMPRGFRPVQGRTFDVVLSR